MPGVLARSGAVLAIFTLLAWLPVLALPGIRVDQPFLTLGLVASLAAAAFLCANHALHLWQPSVVVDSLAGSDLAVSSDARVGNVVYTPEQAEPHLNGRRWSIPAGWALALVVVLTLGYTVFMSVLTLARHNVFMTHSFDLGIHDQVVYNALHVGYLRSTQRIIEAIDYLPRAFCAHPVPACADLRTAARGRYPAGVAEPFVRARRRAGLPAHASQDGQSGTVHCAGGHLPALPGPARYQYL